MGRDEEGRLFFTMRLVKGRTLEEIFELVRERKDGWTVTRALGVLQKVSEAMAFAHEHGGHPPRPQARQHHGGAL